MSSSGASAAQYKLDANSNAITLIAADAAALPPSPSPSTQASPADRIEWSRATILDFIEDYRRQRVLWDPNTKGYHIKQTKYEALKLLSQKYGTEIRSIRSKIKSLRSSFHREHGKVINGRSRGVHYQPMWFAYEAIRFILDGERDVDASAMDGVVDGDVEPAASTTLLDSEAADKLALMHSLDLEQLTAAAAGKQQVEQHEDFAARVAAAVAVVAAAAAAANVREREHNMDDDAAASDGNSNGCAGNGSGSDATASPATAAAAVSAAVVSSYCLLPIAYSLLILLCCAYYFSFLMFYTLHCCSVICVCHSPHFVQQTHMHSCIYMNVHVHFTTFIHYNYNNYLYFIHNYVLIDLLTFSLGRVFIGVTRCLFLLFVVNVPFR